MHTNNTSPITISIIGPGAIGLLLASRLQPHARLTLIDHRPERAALISERGIVLQSAGLKGRPVPCQSMLMDESIRLSQLVIIAVKAHQTERAAITLAANGYRNAILTLQNGLGNTDIIHRHLPDASLYAGTTSEGAYLIDQNTVMHAGNGKTRFGPVCKMNDQAFALDIAALFRRAGFDTELAEDSAPLIWSKLLINAGINALTAILDVPNGRLTENTHALSLMDNLIREGMLVADRHRIVLEYADPAARAREVCLSTAANFSSMNQDIRHGRRTEIDFINGAIVSEGKKLGIACPYNEAHTALIHAIETKNEHKA